MNFPANTLSLQDLPDVTAAVSLIDAMCAHENRMIFAPQSKYEELKQLELYQQYLDCEERIRCGTSLFDQLGDPIIAIAIAIEPLAVFRANHCPLSQFTLARRSLHPSGTQVNFTRTFDASIREGLA